MKRSEFDFALKAVFGSAFGASLLSDLYLPEMHSTAAQALASGKDPQQIWDCLLTQTDSDPQLRFIHRADRRTLNELAGKGLLRN
ncbi:DUF3046 domain-containing protein [uncultured Varibaculum sp.]|uniref:DUF3046 domain-containing protein n=1 Tax=uncultured Varibaculum sp. TaxID=413896 RepID=UPI0027D9B96C|nr:DUF3046 domain-containing protein [uncultured Varibaculum sp.]